MTLHAGIYLRVHLCEPVDVFVLNACVIISLWSLIYRWLVFGWWLNQCCCWTLLYISSVSWECVDLNALFFLLKYAYMCVCTLVLSYVFSKLIFACGVFVSVCAGSVHVSCKPKHSCAAFSLHARVSQSIRRVLRAALGMSWSRTAVL